MTAGGRCFLCACFLAIACGPSAPPVDPKCTIMNIMGVDASFAEKMTLQNWKALRNDHGIRFAFIKISQGNTIRDVEREIGWQGTQAAKILRGGYHYYIFSESPESQAKFFLEQMSDLETRWGKAELPHVVDVEDAENPGIVSGQIPAETGIRDLKQFLKIVEEKSGRKPIVYSYPAFWRNEMKNTDAFKAHPLWMAYYADGSEDNPNLLELIASKKYPRRALFGRWKDWTFWQYTSSGYFDGVDNGAERIRFDLSTFNGSLLDLLDYAGIPPEERNAYCS